MTDQSFNIIGVPLGKPRMTRADVWKKRACVLEYRAWADLIRTTVNGEPLKKIIGNEIAGISLSFRLPITPSLRDSQKKKLLGTPHRVRPDIDNLEKGVLDALFENDSCIYFTSTEKHYVCDGQEPGVTIVLIRQ